MKIEYDKEADGLYIQLRDAVEEDNLDIEEGITVDVDETRHIVGIEILQGILFLKVVPCTDSIISQKPTLRK